MKRRKRKRPQRTQIKLNRTGRVHEAHVYDTQYVGLCGRQSSYWTVVPAAGESLTCKSCIRRKALLGRASNR